jgi:hypothetical protein
MFVGILIITVLFGMIAMAGTYTVTQTVKGTFTSPTVTVTNSAGGSITGNAYRLSSTVTNVSSINGSIRLNSVSSGSSLNMTVFYSTDGTNFIEGATVYCPLNTQVSYTISFSTIKTIVALFYMPNTQTWPNYSYSAWSPSFSRTLTDNTTPSISLSEQSQYSNTRVTITATISDSQSGVSVRKWASGVQSSSYFTSSGTSFSSSFSVTANGYYTVYAKDIAGNSTVQYINVTKMDITPPAITATASTEWNTSNIITTGITDTQSGMSVQKWAYGNQVASYFASSGTAYTGNSITVYSNGTYTIYAKDVAGNTAVQTVIVSFVDNTISVTHPVGVDYTINPNLSVPFSAADIPITNNSRIKVSVSVLEFKSISGGSVTFVDTSPDTFTNWASLNSTSTRMYIALGIQVKETNSNTNSWHSIGAISPIYAIDITSKTWLGTLNPNGATGNLKLTAKHGLAWESAYTARHQLTLVFDT